MASLERELTAGPTPPRTGRWSEYAQLSRQIKQAGLLDRRHGYYVAKLILNLVLLAAGGVALVEAAAPAAFRRLRHRAGPGVVPHCRRRSSCCPAGPVRPVPGLFLRSQPQGYADAE